MALFKIAKGPHNAAGTMPAKTTEGFAYFQPYNGNFWIDITSNETAVLGYSTTEPIGNTTATPNRIRLSAGIADKVSHSLTVNGKTFDGSNSIDVGTIGVGYGGTGKTTWTKDGVIYASATNALSQATASGGGAILVTNSNATPTWLAAGTDGYILQAKGNSKAPAWLDPTTGLTAYKTSSTLSFTGVDASGADMPASNAYVQFNGSTDKTISTKTINALNKAGGTVTGTVYFANGTTYYIDSAAKAKFNTGEFASTLTVTGATTLNNTLTVAQATTLSSTLGVTGATTLSSTLGVSGTATMQKIVPAASKNYSLGESGNYWTSLFIGTADSYGSATQPIWWSDGKPALCTSYGNANVLSATKFTSAQSITLTGDVTGTASSQAGWSIAATAWKLTPQAHSTTYAEAATSPTDYNGKLIFTGMKVNNKIGITSDNNYSYLLGFRGYSSKDGGGAHELAFSDTAILTRHSTSAADTWGSWENIVRSTMHTAVGSATQPVWVDSTGKVTACANYMSVVQYTTWTIASGGTSVTLSKGAYAAETLVLALVVTSGEANLNGPITWTPGAGTLILSTSTATSGAVSGYVITARGVEI